MKLMGLTRMQETQDIPTPFQFVIEILMVTGGRLHPNENLMRRSIQVAQPLFPDLPAFPLVGKGNRLDYHAFVWPTNAARTGLASYVNSTDVFDCCFLLGRRSRWNRLHR